MANPKWKEWTEPDKLILLQGWAMDGLTEEQITHNMGINRTTLYKWKQQIKTDDDPRIDIFNAIKKGREVADYEVENALFRAAIGYHYEESVMDIEDGFVTGKKITRKYAQPSVTAQIFWLKNRRSDKWKDKIDTEQKLDEKISVNFDSIAEEYAD